jgi:RNA polymerase sigma-70 factor, ECF subfamily
VTTASTQLSDEALAENVQKGDREQFGILVERYEKKLIRYGRKFLSGREDIEDLVQDIFIKSYQNIKSFKLSERFSPWIYRIAHNTFINGLKKNLRKPLTLFDFDEVFSHVAYEDPVEKDRDETEIREMVAKGLGELAPKYKEALILYYVEELSYKEIAEIVAVPIGTVGIRIKRAKEALKKIYQELKEKNGA